MLIYIFFLKIWKLQITFTGQVLNTKFNVQDMTKFEYKHDVIYFGKCPQQNCTHN